jgi:nitrogen fixation protein NifQ
MSIKNETPIDILEQKVITFLQKYAKNQRARDIISVQVAQVSLMENHLYQDLGFKSRIEMGKFMKEHFPTLYELKPQDKLWKKFIYDSIEEIAPACEDCKDQINCFTCKTSE